MISAKKQNTGETKLTTKCKRDNDTRTEREKEKVKTTERKKTSFFLKSSFSEI